MENNKTTNQLIRQDHPYYIVASIKWFPLGRDDWAHAFEGNGNCQPLSFWDWLSGSNRFYFIALNTVLRNKALRARLVFLVERQTRRPAWCSPCSQPWKKHVMLWRCCVHHGNEEHGLRMGYWLGPELDKGPISKETLVVDGKKPLIYCRFCLRFMQSRLPLWGCQN